MFRSTPSNNSADEGNICRWDGQCKFADACKFRHIKSAYTKRDITKEPCAHYARGLCKYGETCQKIHNGRPGVAPSAAAPAEPAAAGAASQVVLKRVVALHDRKADNANEMSFTKGQLLDVTKTAEGWLYARPADSRVPSKLVPAAWTMEVAAPLPVPPPPPPTAEEMEDLKQRVLDLLKARKQQSGSFKALGASLHQKKPVLQQLITYFPEVFELNSADQEEGIKAKAPYYQGEEEEGVKALYKVRTLYDRVAQDKSRELSFQKGDILEVLQIESLGWILARHAANSSNNSARLETPDVGLLVPESWTERFEPVAPVPERKRFGIQCRHFPSCKAGDKCTFRHGPDDRRDLLKLKQEQKRL